MGEQEDARLRLREVRAENFLAQVQKYYGGVLKIPLPWSVEDENEVKTLYTIRSAVVHMNGNYMDASSDKENQTKRAIADTSGVEVLGSHLVVEAEYVKSAVEVVFRMIEQIDYLFLDRYADTV